MIEIIEALQWDNWGDRLRENSGKFITPNDPVVMARAEKMSFCGPCPDKKNAMKLWNHVNSSIKYKNEPEWQTPRKTLKRGVGDCEDFAFLIASMLPHAYVDESKVHAGTLTYPSGKRKAHAWNEVSGMTVDATGSPSDVRKLEYNPKVTFTVRNND